MATQQEVIKAFLRSLDNTKLSGAAAVDEAVRNCSGGKFSSMQNVIDSFIRDVNKYGNDSLWDSKKNVFLEDYCGIILSNDDTGAISGADAGGSYVKTEDSIVQESGAVLSYPSGGTSTINGLTFHWPERSMLSNDEQAIVDRIYTWWAKGALNLIQESYGMSFVEADASVKDITLRFYSEADDNVLASVSNKYSSYTGKTNKLTLNINMHYYAGFDRQDTNGASSNNTAGYLDRTLAHEFVHAVMAANIDNFSKLPHFVKEGLAELVHGIDDERKSTIKALASKSNLEYVREMFETELQGGRYIYEEAYAGGYMLFRYLAKQSAASASPVVGLPKGVSYNAAKTTVTIAAPFSGTWNAKDYAATVRTVDASKETNNITIKAGAYNSTIKAGKNGSNIYGQGGNDTIHGGAGKDVFWYGTGDGADTINNFQSGKDVLRFYNKAQLNGVTTSGTNVVLKSGTGSVKLVGKTNQRVDITDINGKNAAYYFGRQDKTNTFIYGTNNRYYGSVKYNDVLRINAAATVSLANTTLYHDIDSLDATGAIGAVKLTGGAKQSVLRGSVQNDTLIAGVGGAELFGGKGNDTYYGGKGKDKIYWGSGLGNDVVYSYESNRDVIAFSAGSLKSGKAVGSDVILTANTGNTMTLKNAVNKVILVADTKGKITKKTYAPAGVTYNSAKTLVSIKAPFKGTWDAANYAVTVRTIDASKDNNPIIIKAGKYDNTIKAGKNGSNIYGQGGNDTIYGGAGKDVFWYGMGDGADTINNFQSGKDVLRFYNKAQLNGVTTSGTNVVLKSGTGSVKLVGKTNQRVDITDVNGKNAAYYFGRQDKANTFVYGAKQRYYGSVKYKDTLQVNTGATVSLGNTTLYRDIDALDATRSKVAVKLTGGAKAAALYGSAQHDTLTAGSGGATLVGGKGNDTLYGGNGVDKFYWGANLGNDIIHNYTSGKDVVVFSAGSLKSGKVSGQDVILTSNAGNTLTLKKAVGKAITIQGTDGKQVRKTYNIPTTTSLPAGVTYNSQTMTVKLSKGMVTDFSLAGNDVVLKSTAGNIRIANAKDKILNVVNGNGVKATYKVAANIPAGTGAAYNAGKTEVILGKNTHIDYIFNISNYGDMLRTGNATASKANNCILWGSIYDDVLIAGSGDMTLYGSYGNDKLYGGSGKNDFRWDQNMDNDVIYNYTKGQDRILLEYGKIDGYTVSGNDVILKSGSATLTVKDIKPGELTVYNSFSNQFDTYWYDKKLPNGISYNSAQKQYVLSSSFGNNNSMAALATLPSLSTALDASAVQRPYGFNIWGDNRDNTIIASAGGGLISTGSGKDTVYFGKGKDILSWDNFYEGEITLHGYKKGEDSIKLGYEDKVSRYEMQGNDLVMWNDSTYRSSKLTIKNTKLSDVTILDYSGNEVSISQKSAKLAKCSTSSCLSMSGKSSLNYVQDVMGVTGKKQSGNLMPLAGKTDSMALAKSLQIVSAQTKKK